MMFARSVSVYRTSFLSQLQKGLGAPDVLASSLIVALAPLTIFGLALFLRKFALNDGDTWSHIATGEWILAHAKVPHSDPFSYTMGGAPWIAHEWLSEVLFALAFRWSGLNGVVLLAAAAGGAAILVMALRVARDLSGPALLAVLALAVGLCLNSLLARPHLLALPLLAAWCSCLLAARDAGGAPPLWLAGIMTLWSNLHGGFVVGLALIAPFALEAVFEAPQGDRLAIARRWTLFGLSATAAALVNPYGVDTLLLPLRLMSLENLSRIGEWAPQDFSRVNWMEITLIVLVGFALAKPMATPPMRSTLVAILIAMALSHVRHMQLLGIIGPMALAPSVAAAIGRRKPSDEDRALTAKLAIAAALAVGLAMVSLRLTSPIVQSDGPAEPISALRAVRPELRSQPVLNGYGFGGYLIWSGVRPFIDARADMYGNSMINLYLKLNEGDPGAIDETLRRYRIAWTIFAPRDPIVSVLDHRPGWRRLYADPFAVVHVREQPSAASE